MRKRKIKKTIFLSEEENKLLNIKCIEKGMNQSQYIRFLICDNNSINESFKIYEAKLLSIKEIVENMAKTINKYGYLDYKRCNKNILELAHILENIKRQCV